MVVTAATGIARVIMVMVMAATADIMLKLMLMLMLIMFAAATMFMTMARRVVMTNYTFGGWMESLIFSSH
jgi:hypothetical protein